MSRTAGDDLDQMNFAQLLQLARQLKVPGRGTARVGQLREGIRAARAAAAPAPTAAPAPVAAVEPEQDGLVVETEVGKIRAGSIIVASVRGGSNTRYTVLDVEEDIKNGYSGWYAEGRWGYSDQVVRVVKF